MERLEYLLLVAVLASAPGAAGIGTASNDGAVGDLPSEPLRWLTEYLRIDTTNPPGNEQRASAYLAAILHREGIPTRMLVSPKGRVNLLARLPATVPEPDGGPLFLLHHMDTVPAGPEGWHFDPLGGVVYGGMLWGRGALDTKSLGVAHLAALVELKRRHLVRTRDVVFLASADEESGGAQGVAWLLDAHPELVEGAFGVLTEGGMNRELGDRIRWWGIEVAQKRPLWLRVTARGPGGHGARVDRNTAAARLVRGLSRLVDRPPGFRVSPPAARYFAAVAPLHGEPYRSGWSDLAAAAERGDLESLLLPGMAAHFKDSVQVTVLAAGDRINVIPAEASAELDVRLLPDSEQATFLAEARALLGPEIEVEVLLDSPPVAPSPVDHPLYRCTASVLETEAPVVPAFLPGVTDARHLRERGQVAYGISPFVVPSRLMTGVHGVDERIPVAVFEEGVERMVRIVEACAASE